MQNVIEGFKMLPTPALIVAILVVIFFLFGIISKIVKFSRKTAKILSGAKYRKNPSGEGLSGERLCCVNIGAINGEQTMFYTDSLATGDSRQALATNLMEYYGISPAEEPAESVLDWLRDEGHRCYFDSMKKVFASSGINGWQDAANDLYDGEQKTKCIEFLNNLEETLPALIEGGFVESRAALSDVSVIAWDMGRLVNITRCCYDCKYISEETAWEYIFEARKKSVVDYANWKDFSAGYVVGRAMWGGNNLSLSGIMGIANGLVDDDDSPWKSSSFK